MDPHPQAVGGTGQSARLLVLLGLALAVPLLAPPEARADTIFLKNGNQIDGRIVAQDATSITIDVPAHTDPVEAMRHQPIRTVILRENIERVKVSGRLRSYAPQETVQTQRERGLGALFRTLPPVFLDRWDHLMERYATPEKVVLACVLLVILVLLPALLLHAGSSVVGVTDPTYSRALLCIILLAIYTIAFGWLTNAIGWLNTMILTEETPGHLALLIPLYLLGQTATYKWVYVATWGKAVGLVLIGLLVAVITTTGLLVLLTILAS